ncbi:MULTISPECIES: EAL domain-containing protein [unclassified Frankia]|uniref:putative bifunctional diguanylate cyclase/phosphodiesterase n=1 Tax=unclassified Frankia TaxID=2632575 RepID=UPI0027DEA55A|nr:MULTISPECIES: EAL domain-containing protein [unclassified Frankia]
MTAARHTSVFDVFADHPAALAPVRQALAGECASGVFEAYGKWFEQSVVPIFGADGTVDSVASITTEVTDREEALAQLRQRSAEQAIVAELGRRALDSPDPESVWRRATAAVAQHLGADRVTLRETASSGGQPGLVIAADTRSSRPAGTATTLPAAPGPTRGRDGRDGAEAGPARPVSPLSRPVGRSDDPAAVLTVQRGTPGDFTDHEVAFLDGVATVLAAADARFRMERQVHYQAVHDGLTGLPNRTALLDRLQRAVARARRYRRRVGLLFIDLDGFKTVNDSLGHQAGDQLLCDVADQLRDAVRPVDLVARMSGDEFAVLCDDDPTPDAVRGVADRLVTRLAAPRTLAAEPVIVTGSIGIALIDAHPNRNGEDLDADGLLRAADLAMYAAKRQGGGRCLVFEENMRTDVVHRVEIERDLRRTLECGNTDLRLLYQPSVSTSGQVAGAEALVRWRHPDHGLLEPDAFVPIAEEAGLIVPLGRWVLETACRTASGWGPSPPDTPKPRIAVGISPIQLADDRLLADVSTVLAATNADSTFQLCLEITEAALVRYLSATTGALRSLHDLGVLVYLDDFGFGQSCLGGLPDLPIDGIKTDHRLIARITTSQTDRAVVEAVIRLAHALGLTVTADGVETADQAAELRRLDCDLLQGHQLGQPRSHLPDLGLARSQ